MENDRHFEKNVKSTNRHEMWCDDAAFYPRNLARVRISNFYISKMAVVRCLENH